VGPGLRRDAVFLEQPMTEILLADTPALPPPDEPAQRPVVTLAPGGQRRAEGGHPWIYSNEIAMDAAAKALPPARS